MGVVAVAALPLNGLAHRVRYLVIDGMLAVLVAGHALLTRTDPGSTLGAALLLTGTLCLAWRRRAPLAVLAVGGATFCAYGVLWSTPQPVPFALLIALYTVTTTCSASVSLASAGALAVTLVTPAAVQGGLSDDDVLGYIISLGAALALGSGVRLNQARTELLEDQARQLEREQAATARLAVEQERARIARELHDIVAHNVSVIVAQARATQRVFEPEHARQALGSIESIGREALTEMRRLVGVMHTDGVGPEWTPQPQLDHLPVLVAQLKRAGLIVDVIAEGNPRPLPAGIELNAFRIVQEALTNTLKHAGSGRARVILGYHARFLELRITDDGRGCSSEVTPGHGLVGMRQRAALLRGEVVAGPGPAGGFQVSATLPLNGELP